MNEKNELPNGWVCSTVGDLCQIAVGFAFKSDEFVGDGIRLLRGENIEPGALRWNDTRYWPLEKAGLYQHLLISEGDIILAMDRPVVSAGLKLARASASDVPCLLVQRVARIRPKADLCWSFLFWAMQSSDFVRHLLKGQTGTQLPHINTKSISAFEMHLAPPNEQRRIVAKIEELFSDLDAGEAALKRAKANLKRYRAAVLKAAVEGKLTEEWRTTHPAKEPASTLLDRILKERRQKWETDQLAKFAAAGKQPPKNWREKYVEPTPPDTTGLPELPVGWCWVSVDQLGDIQLGRQRSPKNRSDKFPTKYIRAANLTESGLNLTDVLDMEFQPSELEAYRLHPGDVLLSEASGSPDQVGKPVVWNGEIDTCCFQNTVIRLRPMGIPSEYPLTVFKHYYSSKFFARVAAGVGINHLSAGKFSALPFPLAPLAEQKLIVLEVEERLSSISVAEQQLESNLLRASRLRQSILKQAFAGKLVRQDPMDESASVLLERLRASRSAHDGNGNAATPARTRNRRAKSKQPEGTDE